MSQPEQQRPDSAEWEGRKRNNVRLGWTFAVIVLALFVLSIFKYRPV